MNSLKLLPLLIISGLISNSYAASFIGVSHHTADNEAYITSSLNNNTGTAAKNSFISDESLKMSFQLNIAPEDIGLPSSLFLVVYLNDQFYMKTESGQWQPWDGNINSLQAYTRRTLAARESIDVLSDVQVPPGEYLVFAAYQDAHNNIKYSQSPATFIVSNSNSPALHRIQSTAFFTDYMQNIAADARINIDQGFFGSVTFASEASSQVSDTSQTNLQEAGVDESDSIKTSGDILFSLEQCETVNKTGASKALIAPYSNNSTICLSSYQIQADPASATRLGRQVLNVTGYSRGNLFLNRDSTDASPADQLIWIATNMSNNIWTSWGAPRYWYNNSTTLKFFDISSPGELQEVNRISLQGALISSRRIGDQLYLITRKNHSSDELLPLPTISFNSVQEKPLVAASDCYIPASQSHVGYDGTIITITSLSISNPEDYQSSCITGNIDTAYVSTEALYLATSRYPYQILDNSISYDPQTDQKTEIHKFAFTENHVTYKGSGVITGHLGWDMDKKPFRMGEYNGILKVASSLGSTWDMTSTTQVSVLRENSEKKALDVIATIKNLGKPGEKLYAARFIANRGYLVTFRITDPLYLLDFSDPEKPQLLGELEINGYSDYLHPIGENYLLGIGKEAIADPRASDSNARGAWYQGIKLALFDVSEGDNLREVQSIVIGQRGSSSALLNNHKALAWLPGSQADSFRLVIPINEHTTKNDWSDYSKPSAFYSWTQTGAYVFDIHTGDTPDLSLSGQLISESLDKGDAQTNSNNDRVVLQGDSLHFIHNDTIYSSAISDLD